MFSQLSSRVHNPLVAKSTKQKQATCRLNTVQVKAAGTRQVKTKGKPQPGTLASLVEAAKTPAGNEPNWIPADDVAMSVRQSKTMMTKKTKVYIGKEKSPLLGNVGEPRVIDDYDEKYPSKEAYGPWGIFDNASGGWAGGEAGLKLMFLAAATEKLKPGTSINVRYNLDLRSMPFSKAKGKVIRTITGVNECKVELEVEDPEPWWESAVYAGSAVLLGGVAAVDLLVASQGWEAQSVLTFVLPFTAINAGLIYLLVTKNFLRRRTNGKPVQLPVEHVFIPGVDKVPDLFWDGTRDQKV